MTDRNRRYAGKIIVVTGAAGGLGRGYAMGFAGEGGHVVAADINGEGVEETAALIRAAGGSAEAAVVDMSDEASIHALGAAILARHPVVDVLINNAGIAYGYITENLAGVPQDRWMHFLAVNTVGPVLLADALRPALAAAKAGVILNQSSMASFSPGSVYGVTKSALNAVTYGLAHAFGVDGIRVLAIAPGLMETSASRAGLSADLYGWVQQQQVLKDAEGKMDDITQLGLFLASEEARFMTADVISCDAGNAIRGWRN